VRPVARLCRYALFGEQCWATDHSAVRTARLKGPVHFLLDCYNANGRGAARYFFLAELAAATAVCSVVGGLMPSNCGPASATMAAVDVSMLALILVLRPYRVRARNAIAAAAWAFTSAAAVFAVAAVYHPERRSDGAAQLRQAAAGAALTGAFCMVLHVLLAAAALAFRLALTADFLPLAAVGQDVATALTAGDDEAAQVAAQRAKEAKRAAKLGAMTKMGTAGGSVMGDGAPSMYAGEKDTLFGDDTGTVLSDPLMSNIGALSLEMSMGSPMAAGGGSMAFPENTASPLATMSRRARRLALQAAADAGAAEDAERLLFMSPHERHVHEVLFAEPPAAAAAAHAGNAGDLVGEVAPAMARASAFVTDFGFDSDYDSNEELL
jgi:hypothetical protein